MRVENILSAVTREREADELNFTEGEKRRTTKTEGENSMISSIGVRALYVLLFFFFFNKLRGEGRQKRNRFLQIHVGQLWQRQYSLQ